MARLINHVVGMSLGGCDRAVSSQAFCEAYTVMVKLMEVINLLEEYEQDDSYDCDLLDSLAECQFTLSSNVVTYINRLCPTAPYRFRLMYRAFIDRSSNLYSNGDEVQETAEVMTDTALLQKFCDNAEIVVSAYSISEEDFEILKEEVLELISTLGCFLWKDFQLDKSYVSLNGNGSEAEDGTDGVAQPSNAFVNAPKNGELVLDECVNEALSYLEDSVEIIIENVHSIVERYEPKLTIFEKYPVLADPFFALLSEAGYKELVESVEGMLPNNLECVEDIQELLAAAAEDDSKDVAEELALFIQKYELT